jgi:CheY-like chemotaxis protein
MEPLLFRLGAEVRQGVHHMIGSLEVAADESSSAEDQGRALDLCREAADHLLRTTDDLLELARPDEAAANNRSVFDAAEAVEEIAGLMGVLAKRKGLLLEQHIDRAIRLRIAADKHWLQDSLRRLLDNAVRYTAAGVISVSAGCAHLIDGGCVLRFEVSDTGPGIPAEVLADFEADVWQPRVQGLSLRILHKRMLAAKGTFSILSNTARGAAIRLDVPVSFANGQAAKPVLAPGEAQPLPPLRILIAEDSDASFNVFRSYVKTVAQQITRVTNGAEAVEMAKQGEYDFIVLDVNMPRLDGYSATRQIREWETHQGRTRLPILLISADDRDRQSRMGGAAGCSGYLTKPTTKAQVLSALSYYSHKLEGVVH